MLIYTTTKKVVLLVLYFSLDSCYSKDFTGLIVLDIRQLFTVSHECVQLFKIT